MKVIQFLYPILFSLSMCSFGQTNSCIDFNGSSDFLLAEGVNDLGVSDFTIEAWVNCESTAGIGQFVVNKGLTSVGTPSNAGYGIRINDLNMNDVEFIMGHSNTNTKVISANALSVNNWHHIAGVRSGIYMYLYVDGNLVATDSTTTVYNVDTDIELSIGANYKNLMSSTAEFMNGKIDEVRIWNIARSQEKIVQNMNCVLSADTEHLIALYNMNEGSGTDAIDSTQNSNDATFMGNPSWTSSFSAGNCNTLTLEETESDQFEIYPNPSNGIVNVSGLLNESPCVVYNIQGQCLHKGTVNQFMDLSNLNKGAYIIQINSDGKSITKKIVIQ